MLFLYKWLKNEIEKSDLYSWIIACRLNCRQTTPGSEVNKLLIIPDLEWASVLFTGSMNTGFLRPYESGENAMLIIGTLEPMFTVHQKAYNEEYGELVFTGSDIASRLRTNIGIGVGWQRQLARYTYLNLYPSFNFDLRADRPFNSITLTAEILFGVY